MSFWSNISPTGAVKDFTQVWHDNPYRWRVLAVSIAATLGLMIVAIPESQRAEPRPPEVTYITSFAPGRTDEEIMASNLANEEKQAALEAERERRAEFRKELYRQLGRATGIDVDAMERKIAQDRAAEERAAEERAAAAPAAAPKAAGQAEEPPQAPSGRAPAVAGQ